MHTISERIKRAGLRRMLFQSLTTTLMKLCTKTTKKEQVFLRYFVVLLVQSDEEKLQKAGQERNAVPSSA
jgi:hypothetical protein